MAELKYEKVKENSEKMATQIFEYIHAAGLTGTERDKLFLELSTSFLTATVHNGTVSGAKEEIRVKSHLLAMYATEGFLKVLAGENENVLSDLSD